MRFKKAIAIIILLSTFLGSTVMAFAGAGGTGDPTVWSIIITIPK